MKRSVVLSVLLLVNISTLAAQPFMTNINARNAVSLNGDWQVIVDVLDCGQESRIHENLTSQITGRFVEYTFDDTSVLKVPGDWNSQMMELKYYESSVWYKKDFDCPAFAKGRLFLYFGAANYYAEVYLNGEYVGNHEGGFTPFEFEVTGKVKEKDNYLIVKVNNSRKPENIPALKYDWWNYGGLTRDVFLIRTENAYLRDYTVKLVEGRTDRIGLDAVFDGIPLGHQFKISVPELNIDRIIKISDKGTAHAEFNARPQLWTSFEPKLYDVIFSYEGEIVKEKIGFRTIEVNAGKILLNGSEIFLKGINCHDEIPMKESRACSDEDAALLLTSVKELGCNFLRLTHYPHSENMVRMAEEMGIMMWEEIPLWQKIAFSDPETLPKAERMLEEMISRDKNRCAIIMWSVSNETKPGDDRNAVLSSLIERTRELDPSRLVTSAFSHTEGTSTSVNIVDPVCELVDVIGINKYYGWYEKIECAPQDFMWNCDFGKPIIFSEFGAEALYGNHGSADVNSEWYEEYQKKVYEDNLKMLPNIPYLAGLTPWCLYDFRSPYRFNHKYQKEWNRKGLLSEKGEKKMAWYVMKEYYDTH